MEQDNLQIFKNRNFYRKRRNFIRRVLLVLLVFSCVFFLFRVTNHVKNTDPKIEILGARVINQNFLLSDILKQTNIKNFFLLSPKKISCNLLDSFKLLEDVVVRKYIFPEIRICVFLREKNIWARILNTKNINQISFVTNEGDIILGSYLNPNNIPTNILDIYSQNDLNTLSKDRLVIIKDLSEHLKNYEKFLVSSFIIDNKSNLDFSLRVDGKLLRVKAGNINETLFNKIKSLSEIIETVGAKLNEIKYIDLTLDTGAIIKM